MKTPSVNDIIKSIKADDKTLGKVVSVLSDSRTSKIQGYINTGNYSLNRVISGDPRKGIPIGLITAFAGEESTGKTFICCNVVREAQKDGFIVIYVETENSPVGDTLQKVGANADEIVKLENCFTIADIKNNLVKVLRSIHEKYPENRILVIIDSIANIVSDKQLYGDIEEGKIGHDQGMKAKELKALAAILTAELGKCNGTMLVTNHIYLKPGQNPHIPPEQVFSGGSGFLYTSSVIVYMHKRHEKEETENVATGQKTKRAVGVLLKATTKKNRLVPEGKTGEFHVSFSKGMNKWYGLLEDALLNGYFEEVHGGYNIKHLDKKVSTSELYTDEVWQPIFDELSNKIAETSAYKNMAEDFLTELDDSNQDDKKELESNVDEQIAEIKKKSKKK